MIKKISFVLFLLINLVGMTHALIISEIMYDPEGSDTGHEWIEVFNNSSSSIDLTQYKFFENNTNHSISISQGNVNISPNGYAIIADNPANFIADYPSFTGSLFDSAFSLSNTGETFSLKDSGQSVVFSTSYTATSTANSTGGTYNYATSSYEVYLATPGTESDKRSVSVASGNSSNGVNSAVVNLYTSDPGRRTYLLGDLYLLAPHEIYGVAGSDIDFNLKVLDKNKAPIITNTYWSFGDGTGSYGATGTHRYVFPGKYDALVEVDVPAGFGIEKIKVNVVKPDVSIVDIQNNPPSLTIKNNGDDEIDLQYASIKSEEGVFPLSKHLLLSPQAEVKISGMSIGFRNLTNPKIVFSNGEVITQYSSSTHFLVTNIKYDLPSVTLSTTTKSTPVKVVATKNLLQNKVLSTSTATSSSARIDLLSLATTSPRSGAPATTTSWLRKIFYFFYE